MRMMNCRPRLEMLNLSQNRLDRIQGLKMLGGLIALNLGTYTGTRSVPCNSVTPVAGSTCMDLGRQSAGACVGSVSL